MFGSITTKSTLQVATKRKFLLFFFILACQIKPTQFGPLLLTADDDVTLRPLQSITKEQEL